MRTTRLRRANSVRVQYAVARRGVPAARSLARWARAASPGMPLTLRVVGAREGRLLNRTFRKKDRPTNVLSFPLGDEGDIVLCHPVVRREARSQRKRLAAHYAHLVVHGVLHLRGFAHGRAMERQEVRILRGFGVADPYIVDR
jgi:probable rRNA maturation factor